MKIGIIGAMVEEITPLLKYFKNVKKIEYAQNIFYQTSYNGLDLIIAYSKIGKVNAGLTTALIIEKFNAQKVIFTGVAGAIDKGLKIGDLLVATRLVQHDVDISAFGHALGFIPESGDYIDSDKTLVALATECAKSLNINIKQGIIATGDQFVAKESLKQFICQNFNAMATEMEGAALAYVCKCLNVPFVVIRSISDDSSTDANFSFDEFLESSAKESAQLVIKMLERLA